MQTWSQNDELFTQQSFDQTDELLLLILENKLRSNRWAFITHFTHLTEQTFDQVDEHFPVGEQVHVLPADTWLQGGDDGVAGAQHGVVDHFLRKF